MSREKCWMLDICEKYDKVSAICDASDDDSLSALSVKRCDAGTKTIIAILDSIHSKLDKTTSEK